MVRISSPVCPAPIGRPPRRWYAALLVLALFGGYAGLARAEIPATVAQHITELTRHNPRLALAELEPLINSLRQREDTDGQFHAMLLRANAFVTLEQAQPSLDAIAAARELIVPDTPVRQRLRLDLDECAARFYFGQFAVSRDCASRVLAAATPLHDPELDIDALTWRGAARSELSDTSGALQDLNVAYAMADKHRDNWITANVLTTIANVYDSLGNPKERLEHYEKALAILGNTDSITAVALFYNIAMVYQRWGQSEPAQRYYYRALKLARQLGDDSGTAATLIELARIETRHEHPNRAYGLLEEAQPILHRLGDADRELETITQLAELDLNRGNAKHALERLERGGPLVDRLASPTHRAKLEHWLSKACAATGDYKSAAQHAQAYAAQLIAAHNLQLTDTAQRLRIQFDTRQKEAANRLLVKDNQLQQEHLARQESERLLYIGLSIAIAALAALSLLLFGRESRMRRRFAMLAMTDELTGIANRRHIMEIAEGEMLRARRSKQPLCVAMVDIDHFKSINDSFGHEAGDKVLQHFVKVLHAGLRRTDNIGRMGGEEFLLVLPASDSSSARSLMQRIRQSAGETIWPAIPGTRTVTFSAGLALMSPHDADVDSLMARADQALYVAKNAGRNRLIVANPPVPASQSTETAQATV